MYADVGVESIYMYESGSLWGKWDLQVQTIIDDGYVQLATYADELKKEDPDRWSKYVAKVGGEEKALKFDSKAYFGDSKVPIKERCSNYAHNMMSFLSVYRPELRAILVTDHNYDHELLIDELIRHGQKADVKALPGIEINVGGVHLLVGFGSLPFSKATYSAGLATFQSKIGIDSKLNARGKLNVTQHDIREVVNIINDNDGFLIFPHCNTDNGLFQERQQADRENLADIFNHSRTNILQTHSKQAADELIGYIEGKTSMLNSSFCVTIAPDSRKLLDIGSPDEKGNYQWIKADPTFKGLQQLITEPKERMFVGKLPEKLESVEFNKDKYIKSIEVRHNPEDPDSWFNQKIQLNPGLVAIIGKKGSGKSALTDILGLAGSTHVAPANFSFLTPKKFLKRGLAAGFDYELVWEDESKESNVLSRQVEPTKSPEKVKYLPQKYVESICSEFGVSDSFQKEINRVIFSYVPLEKRLERTSLEELLSYKDAAIEKSIMGLKINLGTRNVGIQKLEAKKKPDYTILVNEKIEQKQKELDNLKPPAVVPKPKKSGTEQIRITEINKKVSELDTLIQTAEGNLAEANTKIQKLRLLESQIGGFKESFITFESDIREALNEFGLKFSDVVKLTIDTKQLSEKSRTIVAERQRLEKKLSKLEDPEKKERNLIEERGALNKELEKLKGALTTEETKYQEYLEASKQYVNKRQGIIGTANDNTLVTLESLKTEKLYIEAQLNIDLETTYEARNDVLKDIFEKKQEKISYYEEIYKPLTDVLEREKAIQEQAESVLEFKVEPVFDKQSFINKFETFIDQRGQGNFRGKAEGIRKLVEILDAHDLKSPESVKKLIEEILDLMNYVSVGENKETVDLDKQLLNFSRAEFYDFLFGIDFIEVEYNLRFNGKELSEDQFSPGEKGALLLIFYLLIEKGKVPLIIDQPEENLDNESVFDLLVPYIRRAKCERQVILVTHNPNLAVVCDAEQIIHTSMDKKKNTIRYSAGSLEDPATNKRVSDILEGTLPAFDVRNSKYYR